MLGAIVGDIVGSVYEVDNHRSKDFELFQKHSRFTDDTILTVATADALMTDRDFAAKYRSYGKKYPSSYGARFHSWIHDDSEGPYNSFGNGSAMRVSPVAWLYDDESRVLETAKATAEVTHDHPEGIKGAQATALAILYARRGKEPTIIARDIERLFGYDITTPVDVLRETYEYNETCQRTVPEAIRCFAEAEDFEDAIRNAISIGGDSDTLAAITGSIAEAKWGVPTEIRREAEKRLDEELFDTYQTFVSRAADCKVDSWRIRMSGENMRDKKRSLVTSSNLAMRGSASHPGADPFSELIFGDSRLALECALPNY
jgi:ADP-ribosylglycohydrolase